MLNTQFDEGELPTNRDAIRDKNHGDTIIYFGCPNIDDAYKTLTENGLKINPPEITGYGFKAITFSVQDGYGICLDWEKG